MKKFFAGGAALALAGAGSVALAGPLGAQDVPQTPDHTQYEAAISATNVGPGESLTVSSGDGSCTIADGFDLYGLYVDMFPSGTTTEQYAEGIGMVDSGFLAAPRLASLADVEDESIFDGALAEDGTFEFSFNAPETSDSYDVFAFCILLDEADYEYLEELAENGEDLNLDDMNDLNGIGHGGHGDDECEEVPDEEVPEEEEPEEEPEEEEVVVYDEGHDGHDEDDEGDDEEGDDEEEPCVEEPGDEPPADVEPREPNFLENEVFIATFTVTGGAPPVASPVGGSPSFTG